MNITLLNQYYPPDRSPTARYLRDLAEALAQRGHQVEVLCSQALYRSGMAEQGQFRQVKVRRFWAPSGRGGLSKAVSYAAYYLQAALALAMGPKPDLILALSSPPFLGLLAKAFGKKHAHWVMDAYPQVLFASGTLKKKSLVGRLLSALASFQYQGAASVIALGPDMARRLEAPALVHPLWLPSDMPAAAPARAAKATRRAWGAKAARPVLLYAGNLGRGHRYGEFLEAMRRQGPKGPLWVFMGDGAGFAALKKIKAAEPGLPLLLEVPSFGEAYAAKMAAADFHLVSLQEGWQGLIVPSKLQASLAAGKPVIFVGPRDSEPARWIAASRAGWLIGMEDWAGFLRASKASGTQRSRKGKLGRAWAEKNFGFEKSLAKLIRDLETAPA